MFNTVLCWDLGRDPSLAQFDNRHVSGIPPLSWRLGQGRAELLLDLTGAFEVGRGGIAPPTLGLRVAHAGLLSSILVVQGRSVQLAQVRIADFGTRLGTHPDSCARGLRSIRRVRLPPWGARPRRASGIG
jgi:hypothetical protein